MQYIRCPYCDSPNHLFWARELEFNAVRCADCRLIFCNPRPNQRQIDSAIRTGSHSVNSGNLSVVSRRDPKKVATYRRVFSTVFSDLWQTTNPISWLDIGAGYGETLEAVRELAPPGSYIVGFEPMKPKASRARERGLSIIEEYLKPGQVQVQVISLIDVFSHIPDFTEFLTTARQNLLPNGELFIETGNLADLNLRSDFPAELGLPDHLVFAGVAHLRGFLDRSGFDVVAIRFTRFDGFFNLAKNIAKKLLGRPAQVSIPYSSSYRQVQIRARLRSHINHT